MRIVTRAGRLMAAGVLAAAVAPVALAQSEWVYGPTASVDQGSRRVSAVPAVCGGGFVSVGTGTPSGSTNSNVYVVRTTAAGAPIWELQYDIGPGSIDRGESIAVLAAGSGFVVAGSTQAASTAPADAFLMRLNCGGGIVWLNLYGSSLAEGALDVIEAQSGDAAFGTAAGDLVAAGFATSTAGNPDAMLFRVRNNGALIWHRRYDVGSAREQFRALAEARPIAPALTGDIVAAGWLNNSTSTLGDQGYVARVNGNNGLIGAAPQCAAHYGDSTTQRFEAVTDLRATTSVLGHLVFGGVTNSATSSNDIYLLRTQANPCLPLQQRRIGDPVTGALGDEWLFGLKEIAVAMPTPNIAPFGNLALTGYAGRAATSVLDNDAFLLVSNPTTLAPNAGSGRLYGDHGTRQEVGVSVFPHAAGFTIAGWDDADPQAVGDPRDLYLINADPNGKTSCEATWAPTDSVPPFPVSVVTPVVAPFMTASPKAAAIIQLGTAFQSCP
jgi:hypothetical protein